MGNQVVAGILKGKEKPMKIKVTAFLLLSVLLTGCKLAPTAPSATVIPVHQSLITLNGLANTMSIINLSTGSVLVNGPPTGQVPQEIHFRTHYIYVVNSGDNTLQIDDADYFGTSKNVIRLGAGCNPYSMAFQDDNTAYCSCLQTNEVVQVNLASQNVTARRSIPVSIGQYPEGLAVANGNLYIAMSASPSCTSTYSCGDGTSVGVLNLSNFTGNSFTSVKVDQNPQAMALDAQSRLHVLCSGNYYSVWSNVDVLNTTTNSVIGTVAGPVNYSPGLIDIAPNGNVFMAAWQGALEYNANSLGPVTVIDGSNNYLGVSDANGKVYFCDFSKDKVHEFDATTFAAGRVFNAGHGPQGCVYVP